ncbi:diguanylate cyclase [Paenibacillus sp. HWE-109]|uniref:sensor domain-containing diguanylate cyclase n=1 Tax=Paenibacillus sp. HWE-109 TaxID=1306526 RepID=UPI001EDDADF2|nr:diguanylate cyclase [Paenibacillus sp. HWE-109]UKS26819.1 diguanylate cyclase [Paenibacillus sp. HWE-109]
MGQRNAFFANQTLKMRFQLWIGIVIIAFAFSIIVPYYFIEKKDRLDEAENQLKQVISLQSLYIERWNQEKIDVIKRFALSDNAKFHRIGDLKREIQNYERVNSEFAMISYVEKDGYIRSDTNPTNQMYVGDRDYFKYAEDKKNFISGIIFSKDSGKPIITFSVPVLGDQNDFRGAVVGIIRLEMLNSLMKQLSFGETGEVYVLDSDGHVVTASTDSSKSANNVQSQMTSEIIQRAKAGSTANHVYTGFHGDRVYGQYKWSVDKTWIVVGEISQKEVFQRLNQLSITIIIISLVALILSVLAAITIASRIEKPIRYLLRATKIIQNGNYDYQINPDKIKTAPIELRELCSTFNLMSERLKTNITLLEHSALVDQLTEIHNRRYMMLEGNDQLLAHIAAGHTCSTMMLDIDHFKKINDTYGHLIGDRVLHHVAALLKKYARGDTLVARYGGEEFILLALRRNAQDSVALAEDIRECIQNEPYVSGQLTVQLTASIGVAEYSPTLEYGTMILEDMVSRADHALYRAKSGGRNRVELDR